MNQRAKLVTTTYKLSVHADKFDLKFSVQTNIHNCPSFSTVFGAQRIGSSKTGGVSNPFFTWLNSNFS